MLSFDPKKDMLYVQECLQTLEVVFGLKGSWDGRQVRVNSVALCHLVFDLFGKGAKTKKYPLMVSNTASCETEGFHGCNL